MSGEEKRLYSGEQELEPDYPVNRGFWYLINGKPWQSDRSCVAGDLLGGRVSFNDRTVLVHTVHSCNQSKRDLGRSMFGPPDREEPGIGILLGAPDIEDVGEDDLDMLLSHIFGGEEPGDPGMDPLMAMLMEAGEKLFSDPSEPESQSGKSDEMKLQRYLSQVPVIVEGNTLRFDMEQAKAVIARAPEALKMRPSPDLRKKQEEFMERFKRAEVHLKDPEVDVILVSENASKHFMMVSPHRMPFFYWPEEQLEKWSRWEALRRAIVVSGAKVTVQDSRDEDNPKYFVCRDSYAFVNNTAYVSDYRSPFGQMMKGVFEDMVGMQDKTSDGPRLHDFFRKRGQMCAVLEEGEFDGGNIIVHPQSRTVFMGMENHGMGMHMNMMAAESFQDALNRTQNARWEIVPVVLRKQDKDPISGIHAMMEKNSTPFYHLDTGMTEPLAGGEVLIYPGMTIPECLAEIVGRVGPDNIVPVTREEGERRVLNLISNGWNIIASDPSDRLRDEFRERGYCVLSARDFGVKRLGMSDADPHCLTNVISQPDIEPS